MKITEALETATAAARRVKEDHVKRVKGKPGLTDIHTFIQLFRGDERVAALSCTPNRDEMLRLIDIGCKGFGADTVCWTMETWLSTRPANPVTGKDWGPGEMGDVAMNHDGLAQGWVNEAIVTSVANRAGDYRETHMPYAVNGRSVTWLPYEDPPGDTWFKGIVPDTVRQIMQRTTLAQDLAGELAEPNLSYERRMFHQDMGTAQAINMMTDAIVMLYCRPGTARHQYMKERNNTDVKLIDPRDHQ